jgi:hypothetical protein
VVVKPWASFTGRGGSNIMPAGGVVLTEQVPSICAVAVLLKATRQKKESKKVEILLMMMTFFEV